VELPVDAKLLIHHREGMKILDRLVEYTSDGSTGETLIPSDSSLHSNGVIHQVVLIEMVAQCYAAMKSYEDVLSGLLPQKGLLVGISQTDFYNDAIIDKPLVIKVLILDSFEKFFYVLGDVFDEELHLVTVKLKVWQSDERQGVSAT